jgi:hypothetical protein
MVNGYVETYVTRFNVNKNYLLKIVVFDGVKTLSDKEDYTHRFDCGDYR